jgi:hypothetical protein
LGATGRWRRYIATRAAAAVAAHATLDAYAEYGANADVVVLACFGDPGLAGLKEIAQQPVIGMAEAACCYAVSLGKRFAIVTGGVRWGPMLEEFVASLGMSERLAAIKTVAPSGADIARDPEGAYAMLAAACITAATENEADSVILGGAGWRDCGKSRIVSPCRDRLDWRRGEGGRGSARWPNKARTGSFADDPSRDDRTLGESCGAHGRQVTPGCGRNISDTSKQ